MSFDYFAIGDAATALGIPRQTLRWYCDLGKVKAKRASDGSRLIAPTEIDRAKAWLADKDRQKAQAKTARQQKLRAARG